ncbi:hypothetical protein ACFO5X_15780 [Seohaeicola nanhaiensis]|uniref:Mechanosensitive ion channel family protein n=1 Tax=Seohaeicola nanhaiensis TaxID=1387282 RepID=A0ABV9KIM2_9RHOB
MPEIEETVNHYTAWMPDWAASTLIFGAAIFSAILLHRLVFSGLTRVAEGRALFWRSLVSRTRRPVRVAFVIVAVILAAQVAPVSA